MEPTKNTTVIPSEAASNPYHELQDETTNNEALPIPEVERNSTKPPQPKKRVVSTEKMNPREPEDRRTSEIWNHFTHVPNCDPEYPKATCNYCGRPYMIHPKRNGTSNCWNHLENQCKKNPHRAELKKQKLLNFQATEGGNNTLISWKFDPKATRQALAEMIVTDELPFRFVEGKGFRKFCRVGISQFQIPSQKTIARDVMEVYLEQKKSLKSLLSRSKIKVSLTSDIWTSVANNYYMVVTAHFIDDDSKLQKRIINFFQVSDHKGESIGKAMDNCLKEWGVEGVFTITLDNASYNGAAIKWLKNRLKTWRGLILGGEFLHVRCAAHIMNLIVGDGLKDLHGSIKYIRNAVRYVRSSPHRLQKFKECAIARDVMEVYLEQKKSLKSLLSRSKIKVSLTSDIWTSVANNYYVVVTAHFIDDDSKLQKRIINFFQVSDHKGESIGKAMDNCLKEWGVEGVFTITLDNASYNGAAIKWLKNRLKTWRGLILGGEFLHVRCAAHIMNLIVGDGLKDLHGSIKYIRNAVRYVRSSPHRLQKFKECARHEQIEFKSLVCLDVSTRWNSTYLMLDSAVKFRKAFDRLNFIDDAYTSYFLDGNEENHEGPPMNIDWKNATVFVKFLKNFYDTTLNLSASTHVTSHKYAHYLHSIEVELVEMMSSTDDHLKLMAENMKLKLDKYWGDPEAMNKLIYVAVVLDPRYKLKYLSFVFKYAHEPDMAEQIVEGVRDALVRLYAYYDDGFQNSSVKGSQSSNSSTCQSKKSTILQQDRKRTKYVSRAEMMFFEQLEEKSNVDILTELDHYLNEPCERHTNKEKDDFDILKWWKVNSVRFKILSQMARDILAVQVTTVASESAFSTGGRVLDPFRSLLRPNVVEALICCQSWLQVCDLPIENDDIIDEIVQIVKDDTNILEGLEDLFLEK